MAGTALFAEAQVGEFFRVFVAYGIIFVSLAMNTAIQIKKKNAGSGALSNSH